jgi:Na+/melibiose symporter-like transporter
VSILGKFQNLPESKRKIIFWVIIVVVGLGLLFWWVKITQMRLKSFKTEKIREELRLPKFEEELKGLQKFETPEISEEELKELEESLKETK